MCWKAHSKGWPIFASIKLSLGFGLPVSFGSHIHFPHFVKGTTFLQHVFMLKQKSHLYVILLNIINCCEKFPLAPMGVLAPGSAHARPSARHPIDTSGNFPAHVSAESPSNISPNPSEVISKASEP